MSKGMTALEETCRIIADINFAEEWPGEVETPLGTLDVRYRETDPAWRSSYGDYVAHLTLSDEFRRLQDDLGVYAELADWVEWGPLAGFRVFIDAEQAPWNDEE